MTVHVIDSCGTPLMPTRRLGRVRHMLDSGEAEIVCYFPFTIKLKRKVERVYTQPLRVGVDTGFKHVGISISTKKQELFRYHFRHRSHEVKKNLKERRDDRTGRRNRKVRHRKPRFNNRVKSKKKGWIPPTSRHMVESHKKDIELALRFIPKSAIEFINLELGEFDTHKMRDPDVEGEMYQQGELTGFDNVKAFVRWRDGNICQHCHGKSGDKKIKVHHIKHRVNDGPDNPGNLVCLCHTCHTKYHNGEIKLKISNLNLKTVNSLRSAAAMNITKDRIFEEVKKMFPDTYVRKTYGYITRRNRVISGLEKSHTNDALIISKNFNAVPEEHTIEVKHMRRHNRQIHKKNFIKGGIRKRNQAEHFVNGFALNDFVCLDNQATGFITGRMSSGYATIKTIDDEKIHEKTVVSMKRIRLIRRAKGMIYDYKNKK